MKRTTHQLTSKLSFIVKSVIFFISSVSVRFLQQFLESFDNFAFLRTDGAKENINRNFDTALLLVLNCSHCTVPVVQMLIHFLRASRRNVTMRRVQSPSLILSAMFLAK